MNPPAGGGWSKLSTVPTAGWVLLGLANLSRGRIVAALTCTELDTLLVSGRKSVKH